MTTKRKKIDWGSGKIYIPAAAMVARTTNGSSPAQAEAATNTLNSAFQDFPDGATALSADFQVEMPADYNGGTVTAHYDWQTSATSGNVVWQIAGRGYTDSQTLDQALGTAVKVTDGASGTANQHLQSAETAAITLSGSPAASCLAHFRVFRDPADSNDTMGATARLRGVMLTYTRG